MKFGSRKTVWYDLGFRRLANIRIGVRCRDRVHRYRAGENVILASNRWSPLLDTHIIYWRDYFDHYVGCALSTHPLPVVQSAHSNQKTTAGNSEKANRQDYAEEIHQKDA